MNNKYINEENNKLPDENGNITTFDHLLIRDKTSGEVILNKRDLKDKKACLTK